MATLTAWAAEQQVFAAWLQAAALAVAAVVAVAIYGWHLYWLRQRDKSHARQFIQTALALGHEARRLLYDGARMAEELAPQAHQLGVALLYLPLQRAPDPGLIAPLLQLRCYAADIGRLAASAADDKAAAFKKLQRGVDAEIARIEAIDKLQFERPRVALRHRAENGMPTTTVDQYSTFRFSDDIYPEAEGIDFEAVVNNQSVLCTIPYAALNQLAALSRIPGQHHRGAFEQAREAIQRAAERLIREGAKAPVVVRFSDMESDTEFPR